jgi:hypothetical protein
MSNFHPLAFVLTLPELAADVVEDVRVNGPVLTVVYGTIFAALTMIPSRNPNVDWARIRELESALALLLTIELRLTWDLGRRWLKF